MKEYKIPEGGLEVLLLALQVFEKYGFKYCDRIVPEKWLKEKKKSIKYNSFIPFSGKKIERKK